MTRPAYQTRVIAERDDLADRLGKLKAFIDSAAFKEGVGAKEQSRMCRQLHLMTELRNVLDERIANFRDA